MSRIRGTDTAPEIALRRTLAAAGLRYRLHFRTPGGRADIVFPRAKLAVFIDGCFWHGCPRHYVRPRSNVEFWSDKLRTNVNRDRRQMRVLIDCGWKALRVWEHEALVSPEKVANRIAVRLRRSARSQRQWRVVQVDAIGPDDLERRWLEQLLDPTRTRTVERRRTTRKWLGR